MHCANNTVCTTTALTTRTHSPARSTHWLRAPPSNFQLPPSKPRSRIGTMEGHGTHQARSRLLPQHHRLQLFPSPHNRRRKRNPQIRLRLPPRPYHSHQALPANPQLRRRDLALTRLHHPLQLRKRTTHPLIKERIHPTSRYHQTAPAISPTNQQAPRPTSRYHLRLIAPLPTPNTPRRPIANRSETRSRIPESPSPSRSQRTPQAGSP